MDRKEKILIVDDEKIVRESLFHWFEEDNYQVDTAEDGESALQKYEKEKYDLLLVDMKMPGMSGLDLLSKIKEIDKDALIILITAFASVPTAITALKNGAFDYVTKPVDPDELNNIVKNALESAILKRENKTLKERLEVLNIPENMIGESPQMKKIVDLIKTVSDSDSTVLIRGESGTGKELVARALHYKSNRKNKPFIAVNCGAISENLIESELFGHKKGAFTGAISDKDGFMKAANGGTLFLDEISEMPPQLQVKLLRAIQEKEYTPVGTTISLPVNARFITTTNRNLEEEVKAGRFREDLFYRINVVDIHLPSLKEREEDIPLLADHFLNKYRKELNKNIKGIDNEAMRAILNHEWKGEVRELENIIERAVIFCKTDMITIQELPVSFKPKTDDYDFSFNGSLDESVRKFERDYILRALETNDNNKEKTADALRVGLSTLYRKLKELDIKI